MSTPKPPKPPPVMPLPKPAVDEPAFQAKQQKRRPMAGRRGTLLAGNDERGNATLGATRY